MSTILVVDDSASGRALMASLLPHGGHHVLEASDGADGLRVARETEPDLVLADILMPRMDGYEFVRQLRSDPSTADIPVIFYSATYLEQEACRLAEACGVSRILRKPSEPQDILETIRSVLAERASPGPLAPDEEFRRKHLAVLNEKLLEQVKRLEAGRLERERLLANLVGAQEEEAKRIAADIHDDSIQAMTAVGMRLASLSMDASDPRLRESLAKLEETVELAIGRLRHLLFKLRPLSLDRDGLAAALEEYLQKAERDGLGYTLENRLTVTPSQTVGTILFRIAQEALANVSKHAKANRVDVLLTSEQEGFLVRVADDGTGFSVEETAESPLGHLGLTTMRERAELAGGWARIESNPGAGTTVECWVPHHPDGAR